ncbi:MAG: hypothetical protein NT166_22085 [Candidatus Aminicenantes bacterium]|nr:hypothetical protein [Candidatus Aminicenantes bacterium]
MGLKQIFQEGMQEYKRKSALGKEKKNLSQKEKLLSEQLTALGKKAWDSKLDLGGFGNAKDLIANAQEQMDGVNNNLAELEKQKLDLENKKKEQNEAFNAQRKEVEDKKKDVDTRLNNEKKQLKDAQREADNAGNRLKQIAREEEQLNARAAAPTTTEEQKTEIRGKLEAFTKEKEDLEKKQASAAETAKAQEQKVKPLEEESATHQKEIDRIKGEQKKTIGQLDESLAKIGKDISADKNKQAELTKEQNGHFGQLGDKLAAAQVTDGAVASELTAINTTKKEMENIQVGIQSLEHQATDASKSAFSRMVGLIILFVVVIIAIIVALVMLLGPKKEPKTILDVVKSYGDNVSQGSDQAPATPEEAMKKLQEATGLLKKQSEQIQGKEITAADKTTLVSALPTVSGWEMGAPNYNKAKFGEMEYSALETTYSTPTGEKIHVTISDTASASAMLGILKIAFLTNLSREDENGYEKISTYNDMRVIEKYSKNPPSASFGCIVKDRYIVDLKCNETGGIDLLKGFIAGFDFSKLQ